MGVRSSLLLRRFKTAVEKVKFLLSTSLPQWLHFGSVASVARRLSFRDQPGMLDIGSYAASDASCDTAASYGQRSTTSSPAPGILSRTVSSIWAELTRSPSMTRTASDASSSADADVDKRAETFIANFWRHIQMERQASLELRYCKSTSLERTASES